MHNMTTYEFSQVIEPSMGALAQAKQRAMASLIRMQIRPRDALNQEMARQEASHLLRAQVRGAEEILSLFSQAKEELFCSVLRPTGMSQRRITGAGTSTK